MKKILVALAVLTVAIFLFSVARKPSPNSEPNTPKEQQEHWSRQEFLALTNTKAIEELIQNRLSLYTNVLTSLQVSLLSARISDWMRAYEQGQFSEFVAFRDPQRLDFTTEFNRYAFGRIKQDGVEVDQASDMEKLRLLYERYNRNTLESVLQAEFRVRIFRKDKILGDKEFYSDMYSFARGGFASQHSSTAIKSDPTPQEILHRHGRIEIAVVSGPFRCKERQHQAVPLVVGFYWVPSASKWKPGWFFQGGVPLLSDEDSGVSFYF